MLSLIELIQRSSEKDTNSSDASLTLSNKREDDDSLLSLVKNESKTILDLKKQQQETVVKPRKPRQDKNLKLLQASSNENSHLNLSIMSNSNTCDSSSAITGAGGSLSSVSEPSRSSSSIDTGSCNTDELLLAGNSSHLDSPLNQNDLNDLSCSSRRSSFSNNDIGLDVELEQIMINNLDYLPHNNTEVNTCNQADHDSLSPKLKSKQYNNNNITNNKKQNKQPSYCNRNRRSRIVRTPLPPQPTFEATDIDKIVDLENSNQIGDQNFTNGCNNQNNQSCSRDKDIHDESSRVIINDYIIANNNDLEETKKFSNLAISNSKQPSSTNLPCYQYDQSNTTNNSNNQNPLLNEINRRRKKWLVSNSENITKKNNENSTCSSSSNSSSGNELSVSPTQIKTKHLQKNINQKIQQLQNQQQPSQPQPQQQQQTDYPVFKYLSKSLMNTLFTKENPNSNHITSVCNSNLENSKPTKLNKKPLNNTQNSELQAASSVENSNKSDINLTTSSITAANNSASSLKKHSTSNYNYLINKYSTLTSSTSSLNVATTPTQQLKTSLKHNENHKDQDFNPIIIDIIKDLISDVIDSLEKKKPNNNLTNTTKHLNNKNFKTEIEIINKHHEASFCAAKNINNETTIDTEKNSNTSTAIASSNFKLNNCNIKPAPLIKTLINDITQLNKINNNNIKSRIYNNGTDLIKNSSSSFTSPNSNEIESSIGLPKNNNSLKFNVQNEEDAYLDSDTAEEVANLADNALLININYETEHSEVAANNNNNNYSNNNLDKETKSIRKSNNNQICDETYEKNYNKIITNQKSTNEEIIIIKTNANSNNFNDNFIINQAFVYASKKSNNINENNIKVINNNIDDCCNNNKNNKENAIIYDTNDLSNFNNNNNNNNDINYAKLNNYKEYAKVEVNSKEDKNECSSLLHVKNNTTNNISNNLKLLNIKTPKELLKITNNNNNNNNNNINNTKPSDINLKDITLYPPYESSTTTTTTKTKSKILLQNNTNNLDENNLSIIEKNSDMTDLEEEEENKATNNNNSKRNTNAKQTDFIKSGQTNANVLSSNQNNADFPLSTVHLNKNQKQDEVKNDYCDEDNEKIPNEPPPPPPPPPLQPPPPLISSSSSSSENKYDAQLFISNSTESNPAITITTPTEMTTPKENCEIVLEKNFCENNFIKIEDTYKKENKNNYNTHNKEANEEKEENKFSINSNNFSNINIINNEEKLNNNNNNNNLIDDKNCNYSEQILLLNNNNNNINEDRLDKKISLVEEDKKNPEEKKEIKNSNINNSYNNKVGEHYYADETVRLEKEKLLENKEINEIDLIKLKEEEQKEVEGEEEEEEEGKKGFIAISSNEQNDKLVNKSNNEKNANNNEDEVGLLLNNNNNNNKECKNNSNENEKESNNSNNSNNEIASNLELFSKQEETKNNTTYITINSNNNNNKNNNNVENNDSMNSLNHIETMQETKKGIEEETIQKEQQQQPQNKKSSTNNNNNQLKEQETNANNEPDMKNSNNSNEANIILNKSADSDVDVDVEAAAAEIVETLTTEKKEEIFKAPQLTQMNDNFKLENNQDNQNENENVDRRLDVSINDETYPVKQTAEINETNEFEYLGHNVTKVTFKSKEIALIEDCEDEDEKELDRIIKSKSINTFDLFYNPNASTPASRKKASDLFASKSSTFFSTSLTSERKHRSAKTDHSNSSNDDDDDPYVKAALERFDAFCRSKSSHSLDKTSSSATISTSNVNPGSSISSASNTSAQHLNRNKSPFLTRKTITNPDDEPSLRENIGSFIKRRQARVDPSLNNAANNSQSDTSNTKAETINNFTGSTPEIEQVISSMPPISNKILNRSCSETRTIDEKPSTKLAASPMPLSSSSLAKRFLGSLTPQLEPTLEAAVNLDIDEKCYENTISNTINTAPNIIASENVIEINPDIPEFKSTEADERKEPVTIKSEVIIAPKRKQISQTRPSSAGAELNSHHHNNNNNNNNSSSNGINRSINSRHSKEATNEKSPPENDRKEIILSPATKPKQNIIKLELVNNSNKSKLRNDEKSASPPLDKTNLKPPLPPSIPPATVQTVTSLVSLQPSSSSSSSSSTHSSSWRSKLKSIYNEAPIIDGNNKNSTSQLNSPPICSSNEVSAIQKSASSNKPISRIIPLEVKNQKTGTVTIVKPNSNSNSNSRSNSMSMSSNSSSSATASNKKETNFNITPPVSATSLQKNGFLSSSNSGPNDRVRSASSYRASSTSEPSGSQQQSASSLRNSSSFTYRDLSPSKQNSNCSSRALSSSSFHSDSRLKNQPSADESTPTPSETLNESPDPIAEKACNNFMHKLMEMQRQYKPTYVSSSSSLMPTSMSNSFTEQTTTPISSSRTTNLYNDVYKNRSNENIFASSTSTPTPTPTPVPATSLNSYPYSSHLYNSTYSSGLSVALPAAGVLDSLLSNNNGISSSSSSSLLNSENSASSVVLGIEPIRPYVSAIRKRRTLFSDENNSNESSVADSNMASTVSYFTNKNFTSPYVNEYKSPYSSLLSSSASLNKSNGYTNANKPTDTVNVMPNNSQSTAGRNRPLSIVSEESNTNNNALVNLTRSLSAKDSRSTNNETNNFKDDNISTSLMISNTPSQKLKHTTQLKKSNSINSTTSARSDADNSVASNSSQQKLRSTVFDRLAALNSSNSNNNSTVSNKSNEVNINSKAAPTSTNRLTTQKSNSNSCWQLNISSPNQSLKETETSQQIQQQQRRNSIDKTIGDLTQKNMTTIIKDQNEIAIVTSVVPAKRVSSSSSSNSNNSENSSASTSSSSSSLSRIRSLDSKSREKLRSNKDLKKSNVNLSLSTTSNNNHQQTLPPSGSSSSNYSSKPTKPENEGGTSRRKSSISNGVSLTINNNCFNSSSNPSFSSTKPTDNCLSKKDVFERLSKRTNSMKNLAASLNNKATRSTGSPSSDRENDGNVSPQTSSDEHPTANSISKTSVFERLYKSNIAAHMNHQAAILNDNQSVSSQSNVNNLKKNMSLSSANLNGGTPTTIKKLNTPSTTTTTTTTSKTQQRELKNKNGKNQKQDDSETDEIYRHFSNVKNYDGDDSNDDRPLADFQSQQFVF